MQHVAPAGEVYQAGTLSGNPLAVAAGIATLEALEAEGVYGRLSERSEALATGLSSIAGQCGVPLTTTSVGGMFGFYFHPGPVRNFSEAKKNHEARFRRFFARMLKGGINLAPSPYEAGFVSLAHGKRELSATLEAARGAFGEAAKVR